MTASKFDIEMWYDEAENKGATYLIIGLDPFDYDNFPVFVMPHESCRDSVDKLVAGGNRYDEVYDLKLDRKKQLTEHRAVHIPNDSKVKR